MYIFHSPRIIGTVEDIRYRVSCFLSRKAAPYLKNRDEVQDAGLMRPTPYDSSDVRVGDPSFHIDRTNAVDDYNCVFVVAGNLLHEGISTVPGTQVIAIARGSLNSEIALPVYSKVSTYEYRTAAVLTQNQQ